MRALLVVAVAAGSAVADDPAQWPQFRGPGAAGVADAAKVPVQIGPDKNVAWKVPVPAGMSSPVVWGDKLFLTGFDGGKLYTLAYSRADGKELWRAEAPAKAVEAFHKTEGSPAASTPVTDGERVVSYFGSAGLFCYDFAGKELWRYELPTAKTNNDFGSGTSPVLAGGVVVLVRDLSDGGNLYGIDAKSGSALWTRKREAVATGWGSPAAWTNNGVAEVVVPGSLKLTAYAAKTGEPTWSVGGLSAVGCTTPIVVDGTLVYMAWSPGGSAEFKMPSFDEMLKGGDANGDGAIDKAESENTMLKGFFESNDQNKDGKITRAEWDAQIKFLANGKNVGVAVKPGGAGDVSATHVAWRATKGLPYVPTPLAYRGLLYTAGMRGTVSAVETKTGKEAFQDENVGLNGVYASPVAANGHVYFFGTDGGVVVLKAGEVPEVAFRGKMGERVSATPALVENTMYVRTAKHLYAFAQK